MRRASLWCFHGWLRLCLKFIPPSKSSHLFRKKTNFLFRICTFYLKNFHVSNFLTRRVDILLPLGNPLSHCHSGSVRGEQLVERLSHVVRLFAVWSVDRKHLFCLCELKPSFFAISHFLKFTSLSEICSAQYSINLSIQLYPTPSENCSFCKFLGLSLWSHKFKLFTCLHKISSGRYG